MLKINKNKTSVIFSSEPEVTAGPEVTYIHISSLGGMKYGISIEGIYRQNTGTMARLCHRMKIGCISFCIFLRESYEHLTHLTAPGLCHWQTTSIDNEAK